MATAMKPQVPAGHVAKYTHQRLNLTGSPIQGPRTDDHPYGLASKGGVTTCKLYRVQDGEQDTLVAVGTAHCGPHDNFNKRIGRDVALGRALKQLADPHEFPLPE